MIKIQNFDLDVVTYDVCSDIATDIVKVIPEMLI